MQSNEHFPTLRVSKRNVDALMRQRMAALYLAWPGLMLSWIVLTIFGFEDKEASKQIGCIAAAIGTIFCQFIYYMQSARLKFYTAVMEVRAPGKTPGFTASAGIGNAILASSVLVVILAMLYRIGELQLAFNAGLLMSLASGLAVFFIGKREFPRECLQANPE